MASVGPRAVFAWAIWEIVEGRSGRGSSGSHVDCGELIPPVKYCTGAPGVFSHEKPAPVPPTRRPRRRSADGKTTTFYCIRTKTLESTAQARMSTYHQLQHLQGEDHAASPPHSTSNSSSSSSSFRVTPLNMAISMSPEQVVQQVILATKKKHEQHEQKKVKPKRMRKDNSARAKRYREKKKGQLELTLAEVEKLRAHVRELSTLRQIFMEKSVIKSNTTSGSPLRFVHEYFEVFRYGMQLPTPRRGDGKVPHRAICGQRQTQFLTAMTNVDVQFGEAIGIAPVMEQWKMYSALHSTLFLEFLSFRMDTIADSTLVNTTGVLHMRYTRATVAALFPHALAHEEIVAKLVGKEVHLKYTDQWYFDESGKVFRYELNPDMVQALYDAVGSLEAVSILLGGGALLEDGAHIKPGAAARIEEFLSDCDDDEETESDASRSSSPQPSSAAMAIEFLLS